MSGTVTAHAHASAALGLVALFASAPARAELPGAPPGVLPQFLPMPPVPVASPPSAASQHTSQMLDWAKTEDSGRTLEWVWIDAGGGFEQLGMQTFNASNQGFVGNLVKTSSSGGVVSAAVGARLLFFTVTVRGRVGVFDSGQLYRVGPEAGFHIPLGNVEPHVSLGLGYAAVGNLHDTVGGAAAPSIGLRGVYTRAGAGLDYFVVPAFSLGLEVTSELLALFRPALTPAEVTVLKPKLPTGQADLLASSGSGLGGTVAVTAVAGLHF
jgi:hypothetical protein